MAETVWKSKLFWVCRPAMRKTALCCDALQQRAVEILPVFPGKRYGSHNVSRINRGVGGRLPDKNEKYGW